MYPHRKNIILIMYHSLTLDESPALSPVPVLVQV